MNTHLLRPRAKAHRALPLVAGAAAVLFTVSACGGGDSAADTSDGGTESTPTAAASPSEAESAPTESAAPEAPAGLPDKVWTKQAAKAVRAGLPALVPSDTSSGYALTKATFNAQATAWRLELTNGSGAVATVVQTLAESGALVADALGADAPMGEPVDLADFGTGSWDTFEGVDTASMALQLKNGSALVTAPSLDEATAIAKTLLTYEIDPGSGEG